MPNSEGKMKERVGFIGLGLMGAPMAGHILAKGWPLTVLAHRRREAVDKLVALGATEAGTPRQLAARSDVVVLCVTGSKEVRGVVEGEDGLAAAGVPLLIVDCSTSDPAVTLALAQSLAPRGVKLVDAPLARTPKEAEEGALDCMLGGDDEAAARAIPILEAFSRRVLRTGPIASAHTMKLINNFLSMGYASLYAEALTLGLKAGITPSTFDSVVRGGRMDCGLYQMFFAHVLDGDPDKFRFALKNALKDMSYLAAFANAVGAVNPFGAAVRNGFAAAVAGGFGERYVPALFDFVAAANGVLPSAEEA
jgi:3-hydroxyisobutyrate dehydrogenase-like beta-hydroxyacid dehydrogenase